MKKKLALAMVFSLTLGLAACGSPDETSPVNSGEGGASVSGDSGSASDTSGDTSGSASESGSASGEVSESGSMSGSDSGETSEDWNFEGVTLNIAHSTTGEVGDALQAQFDAFCELTGCKIEVELLSSNSEESVYTLEVRAATGNLPDLFQSSIGAQLDKLDPAANIYDLSGQDWIYENVASSYLDLVSDADTGAVYCIPLTTSNVAGCFYNKKVYEELNLEVPLTWEAFLDNCEVIKTQTDKVPVVTPYSDGAGAQILFLSQYFYVHQEDPDFADKYTNREIELHDSETFMRGLYKLNDLYTRQYQSDDPLAVSFEKSAADLASRDAVMTFSRTNLLSTLSNVAPDKTEDIGFFPLPDTSSDVRGVATWMPVAWCVSKTIAPEKEACALALMEYLTTSEAIDAYCEVTTPTGAFMLNNVALPDTISSAAKEAQEWVAKASTSVMEYSCNIKGSNMVTILQMAETGEYTPEEAISEIEKDNAIDARQKGVAGW